MSHRHLCFTIGRRVRCHLTKEFVTDGTLSFKKNNWYEKSLMHVYLWQTDNKEFEVSHSFNEPSRWLMRRCWAIERTVHDFRFSGVACLDNCRLDDQSPNGRLLSYGIWWLSNEHDDHHHGGSLRTQLLGTTFLGLFSGQPVSYAILRKSLTLIQLLNKQLYVNVNSSKNKKNQ